MRSAIREYFDAAGVLEVDTPVLVTAGVTDPATPSLRVLSPAGEQSFLATSPEYHMKRLLAAGLGDIYSLGPAFRADEHGRRHRSEFALVEWYRVGFDLHALMADVAALIEAAGVELPVRGVDYTEVFLEATGLDPLTTSDEALAAAARQAAGGLALDPDDRALALDLLFSHRVVPALERGALTFVTGYPACQAALARLDPARPDTALRFEAFAAGMELANGFEELTDPVEQRARFFADNRLRRRRSLPTMPIDEAFLAALAHGLPRCAGVALGLDRLLMVRLGESEIARVRPFAEPP